MRWTASLLGLSLLLAPLPARALVWPDVAERIEHNLGATDAATRRRAADELVTLGPSRGGPLALRALDDADVDVRVAAARAAVSLRVPAATDKVLPWLAERDLRLHLAACEVARALPTPQAALPLARLLGDTDPVVRAAAADALGAQPSKDAGLALLGKLDDSSPQVRVQIVRALARLGDGRAVIPLVGKVQDSVPEVRLAVARALGDLGDPRAASALLLLLRDPNADVGSEAIAALGRLRAPQAVFALAPIALERAEAKRLAAIAALGRIATPEAVRALVQTLGSHDDAHAGLERSAARDALVAAGPPAAKELAELLAGSPPSAVASSAAWVLGVLRAKGAGAILSAAIRRGAVSPEAGLHGIAGTGDDGALPVVLEHLMDPSPTVRSEARRAAAALLDPARPDGRAVEPLAAALHDVHLRAEEQAELVALLGRTGAPRAAPVLVPFATARAKSVRLAAFDALATLGPAGADATLLEALRDPDPAVRLHGAIAMGEAGSPRSAGALLDALEGEGELDRASVLVALAGVLARADDAGAVTRVRAALDVSAGESRDALLVALGRAKVKEALPMLRELAKGADPDDRRAIATVLAARSGEPGAASFAGELLADPDAGVRAQAAWALRTLGDEGALAPLAQAASGPDADVAVNATAAIARIGARGQGPLRARATALLCPLGDDGRAYVRANAFAGLALLGGRCGDGGRERRALDEDASDGVRSAAATALLAAPRGALDLASLERCAASAPSPALARRCREAPVFPSRVRAVTVFVVPPDGQGPLPRAAYVLELADRSLRAGIADRRGAIVEPRAPEGELSLKRTASSAR